MRRGTLAASLALFLVCLFVFASPLCVLFLWIAAYIIWVSVKDPESVWALQEDARQAEKRHYIERFIAAMNAGRVEQGDAAEEYEIRCEGVSPLVFVFTSSAYGATAERLAEVCDRAAPVFGAIRYTLEQTTTEDLHALEYRIAFYHHQPAETASALKVEYEDIADIVPTFDAIPIGKHEDGQIAYMNFKNRNALIGGLPRMGKSNLLSVLCLGLIRCGNTERLIVASPKILDFQAYKNHAELYETPEQILDAFITVNQEIERRKKYCILHGIKKLTTPTETEPHTVILVDEYAVIKGSKILEDGGRKWRKIGDEIEAELTKIVAQGGFANVQVVITSQRLSSQVIGTDLRELIAGNLVSFANSKQTSDEFIFGEISADAPASKIPMSAQGVAYLYTEGEMKKPEIIKAARLEEDTEERTIEAIEAREKE